MADGSRRTVVGYTAIALSYNACMRGWLAVIALCGCRQILGVDTPVHEQSDAPVSDGPSSIMLTGTILQGGGNSTLANAMVQWETDPNANVVASSLSGSDGKYQLVLPYQGMPLVGYAHVTHMGYVDTYFYPARPLASDGQADLTIATANTISLLCSASSVTCDPTEGIIGLTVVDPSGARLAGVTVSSAPAGTVRYDAGGFPSPSATSTDSDGEAFILNVPAGSVTVDAMQNGKTFEQHTLVVRANVLTLTNIFEGGP